MNTLCSLGHLLHSPCQRRCQGTQLSKVRRDCEYPSMRKIYSNQGATDATSVYLSAGGPSRHWISIPTHHCQLPWQLVQSAELASSWSASRRYRAQNWRLILSIILDAYSSYKESGYGCYRMEKGRIPDKYLSCPLELRISVLLACEACFDGVRFLNAIDCCICSH